MSKDAFDFVAGSIGVVIASNNDEFAEMVINRLAAIRIYSIKRIKSIKDAEIELLTTTCHICLDDLSLKSTTGDRFLFLKKYGADFPVMVLAKDGSIEDGFDAARFGACGVLLVKDVSSLNQLAERINDLFLRTFIIPDVGKLDDKLARICASVLFDQNPGTVASWADASDIHITYLRRKWELWTQTKPKEALFLIGLYKSAFQYYKLNQLKESCEYEVPEDRSKMRTHFLCNKSRFMKIIFREKVKEIPGIDEVCFGKNIAGVRKNEKSNIF